MSTCSETVLSRIVQNLDSIYQGSDNSALAARLYEKIGAEVETKPDFYKNKWDESDVVVITYGDTFKSPKEKPLKTLTGVIEKHLKESLSILHILPFFPWSSDDGFSVINYCQVNESLGEWSDIQALSEDYRIMGDVVINHCSARSQWFENFKKRVHPGLDYFIEVDPDTDVSKVVRPRTHPLLNPVETLDGKKHVWCTFSPDQVDLNFANPEVLEQFIEIIALYMDMGINVFRMDAVAFLWKELGTSCIHLNETHEIIRLIRTLVELRDPNSVVITETNVPNRENLTYFGNANEAHVIYNFSLPPLLVHTLLTGNCRHLKTWMMSMPPPQMGTAYLNFLASHDGIGLRPAEGLLSDEEITTLTNTIEAFGGKISKRSNGNGDHSPYEMNISLFDAFKGTIEKGEDEWQFERFICAHAIMMALEGIPAFYIHSFFGTENAHDHMENTGSYRSINRKQWQIDELETHLQNPNSNQSKVLSELNRLIKIRKHQPAFHPNSVQFTMHLGLELFAFWRQSLNRDQSVFCISNVTDIVQEVSLYEVNLISTDDWYDLIGETPLTDLEGTLRLEPYQTVWLTNKKHNYCLIGLENS